MSTLIKWEEPQSVIDFEWQNKYAPQIKAIWRTCVVTTLILSVPALSVVFLWARFALYSTILGLIGTGFIFPCISLPLWLYKFGSRCRIGEKVLSRSCGPDNYFLSGYDGRPFKWTEIQKYEFVDHPDLPEIRRLVFSLKARRDEAFFNKRYERKAIFNFTPEEVSEQQLQAILHEHLARKTL